MLVKMIELNMTLTQKYKFRAMIPMAFVFPLLALLTIFSMELSLIIMELLLGAAIAWGIICVIAMMHQLYSRSLFGSEAYTYMQFPVSHGKIITSKVITASSQVIWITVGLLACGIVVFCEYAFCKMEICYSDTVPFEEFVKIIISAVGFFGLEISAIAIAFLIATGIIALAIECFLICSEIQLAVIAAKLCGGEFNHIAVGAVVVIAAIIVYAACGALPLVISELFFKSGFSIVGLIGTMVLKTAIGAAFMVASTKIMDRKYSLN